MESLKESGTFQSRSIPVWTSGGERAAWLFHRAMLGEQRWDSWSRRPDYRKCVSLRTPPEKIVGHGEGIWGERFQTG